MLPGPPEASAPAVDRRAQTVVWVLCAWGLTRLLLVAFTRARGLYPYQDDPFDLAVFPGWGAAFATGEGQVPLRDGPWEYPAGAAAVFVLPALLEGAPYQVGFLALMTAADLALLVLLVLRGLRTHRLAGAWLWVAAVPLLGPVVLARYDVLPTLAAAGGLALATVSAPLTAGIVLATGGVLKLWPAVLLPLVLVLVPGRGRLVAGAAGVLLAVAAVTWAYGGGAHLLSFLSYQRQRGIEIESLPALPLLFARLGGDESVRVFFGFGSYQIDGPGAVALDRAAAGGLALVLLGVGLLALRARRAADRTDALLCLSTLLIAGLLCFDKVLSAQYPLWIAGLFAVGLTTRRTLLPAVPLLLAVLGTTQLVYPLHIQDLVAVRAEGVYLTALRNGLLVALTLQLAFLAWRATASEDRQPGDGAGSDERQPGRRDADDQVVRAPALAEPGQRPEDREDR